MSQHTTRTIRPRGFHRGRSGFGGGFGSGGFDLNLTPGPGGIPIDNSVQTAELAVTGTFAAQAPTLISNAAKVAGVGPAAPTGRAPSVRYGDGTVITASGDNGGWTPPAGWTPNVSSPTDLITGAKRTASTADQQAIDDNLEPSVTPQPDTADTAVDGTWIVPEGSDTPVFVPPIVPRAANGGMKWWHWGLIGVAVLGGGFVLMRGLAK
jgi:hypothetical protein